jgi:N4-gp56 family major capsid protein
MADTRVAAGLTVEQWDDKFFMEYLTENRFAGEMGADEASIIQVKESLMKKPGDRVNFALVNRLTNDATLGSDTLEGNEENMSSRSFEVTVNKRRNAVRVAEIDEQFSAISLREAGKMVLKDWSLKDTEDLIVRALPSIDGVRYLSTSETGVKTNIATEAQKDAWLANNADRVLFGAVRTNNAANDHSASLANVDTTADKFNAAAISKMKGIAQTIANPLIRPIKSTAKTNGKRYYIIYAHPFLMDDLKADTTITAAQREVMLEMENNRLFEGGDILWDGCIVKSIEQAKDEWNYGAVGASSAVVCGAFLCGAQAVGAAYAKRWQSQDQKFDYGDKHGVAIESIYGIEKMRFGSGATDTTARKDHGVVTGYYATLGLV